MKFMIYSLRELIDQRSNAETRVLRRTMLLILIVAGGCHPAESDVHPEGRKLASSNLWAFSDGPVPPRFILPYTLKKYPRYGLIDYLVPEDITTCRGKDWTVHSLNALGQCRSEFGDAYRSSTLIIDTVPDFIAVKVVDSSGKSKRFRQSGFGAVFDAKTVLGSDDAIIPLVQAAEYSREIVRYDPEPKNGEPYSLEKIEFIPFVERHALEHGKKGQKM